MKKIWAVVAMLAAVGCISCEEEKNEENPCVESTRSCSADGTKIGVCVNGKMVEADCPGATTCWSKVNRCVECFDDLVAPVCEAETNSVKYCSDGQYKYTPCNSATCVDQLPDGNGGTVQIAAYCKGGASDQPECKVGAKRCDVNGMAQVCDANGKWGTAVACTGGAVCQSGECKKEASCTSNTFQCLNSTTVQKCVGGEWSTVETCNPNTQKCSASQGACVEKGAIPNVGDTCGEDFEQVCADEALYYCGDGNKVKKFECKASDEMICKKVNGVDDCLYDNMGQYCSAEGEVGSLFNNSCEPYAEYGLIIYVKCVNVDGVFYGQESIAQSVCVSDKGTNYVISCQNGQESERECSDACVSTPGTNEYNGKASCDGEAEEGYARCPSADQQCAANYPGTVCVYDLEEGTGSAHCVETCTQVGQQSVACDATMTGGYAVFVDVCQEVDGSMVYLTDYDESYLCTGACNGDNSDCAD